MSTFDTARLLDVAHGAMDKAIKLLMCNQTGEVQAKGDRDLVTEVELDIERLVREHLREQTPEVGFVGEETGATGNPDAYWVLVPVDGTVNFVHGVPLCAVVLGLVHADQPVLGVIDTPFLRHRYWATRGHGAFRDGEPIAVSRTRTLEESLISLSDYGAGQGGAARTRASAKLDQALSQRAQRVRRTGSSAVELAWVADGALDASLTLSNRSWDTAAGAIIAREAGALVVDANGSQHNMSSRCAVAVTPSLGGALLPLLRVLRGTRYWPISAIDDESGSTARSAGERVVGDTAFLATIGVGIGDDDTADTVAEKEFSSSRDAQTWIERELPAAEFPAWVVRRPRGAAGAFLFGAVQRGRYDMEANGCVAWQMEERSVDDVEAYLVEGQVQWRNAQGAAV
ncbi:inositol monophosphatase family protein [Lentzea sp. BCCO 10_0856]|uniref:Inositol-1-monophosphatase n=1 Tax=Lentzea miocenica TaxID=3095431 RepID=A0ABU4TFK3_9PSEU|nr:inositol monophosphatase family protein [Lentzea sp. BCCO 10_0856]MDX8036926.1 inositol monophosphatase family protein [Lentzea sp. BCCO 10_0856]